MKRGVFQNALLDEGSKYGRTCVNQFFRIVPILLNPIHILDVKRIFLKPFLRSGDEYKVGRRDSVDCSGSL